MWIQRFVGIAIAAVAVATAVGHAQEVVTTGPPPALRAHMDAFVKAFNGSNAEEWEKMAETAFTPEWLKRQTPDDRKKLHESLKAQFGTIAIQRAMRQGGPDAPLQILVKGSVASGSLWIDLDDESRFDSIKGEVQKTTDEDRRH